MWLSNQTKDTQATHSAALSSNRTDNGHFVVFTDKRFDCILTISKHHPPCYKSKFHWLIRGGQSINSCCPHSCMVVIK